MKWINFLHLYQPPTQSRDILERATNESYLLLLNLLAAYPRLRLTLNISGSLVELWGKHGFENILNAYRRYIKEGRIELVGTAAYHPILPLIPAPLRQEQIEEQTALCAEWLGDYPKPKGFYLPEMAYSEEVAKQLAALGFSWLILDEIHAPPELARPIDSNGKYKIKGLALEVIFRHRPISATFPPEYIINHLSDLPDYLITAHDAELYGHWHRDDRGYYERVFKHPHIITITASDYLGELEKTTEIKPRSASWESLEAELRAKSPFALWNDPGNHIHQKLWNLAHFAIVHAGQVAGSDIVAHKHLQRGLASCAWWWASERKIGPFSPLSWNPEEIQMGARELVTAVRALTEAPATVKIEAEKLYHDLQMAVWTHHWQIHERN